MANIVFESTIIKEEDTPTENVENNMVLSEIYY